MKTVFFALFTTLLFTAAYGQQSVLDEGWEAFMNNNTELARQKFTQASTVAETKSEALLSLSIASWNVDNTGTAFKHFSEFYASVENPYPYLMPLWTSESVMSGYGKKSKTQLAFIKKLLLDKNLPGTIKAMANSIMGYHHEGMGRFDDMKDAFAKTGAITKWQFVGVFDNYSGSGFNKPPLPLEQGEWGETFKNKVGAEVKWFMVPNQRSDGWIDPVYNFPMDDAIVFAQTFVKPAAACDAFVMTGASGSIKIWINDQLVISENKERNTDLDVYNVPIHLNTGYNRILVQLGQSELDRANFMIRMTDSNGNVLPDLTVEAQYHSYTKETGELPDRVDGYGMTFFLDAVKKNPSSILNKLLMSELYLRNDMNEEARELIDELKEKYPTSTFVSNQLISIYARMDNYTGLTREQESIKKNDPECYQTLNMLYGEANDREDFDEAKELSDKIIRLYGLNENTEMMQIGTTARLKGLEEVRPSVNSYCVKYPDSFNGVIIKYIMELGGNEDLNRGNKVLTTYLKTNYEDQAISIIAENHFKLGNAQAGLSMLEERSRNFPYKTGYLNDLAQIYSSAQLYSVAETWQKKTLEMAPYHGYYHSQLAGIYENMGKDDEALEWYTSALTYRPTDYESRRKVRMLKGEKDLFSYTPENDAEEIFKNTPPESEFPEEHSYLALYDVQRVVYPEGPSEEKVELIMKILKPTGIEVWKEYYIGYSRYSQRLIIDKAEVLKKDGSITNAETYDGSCVFTDLAVGDAIHISYRIENYMSGELANEFWDQFLLQYSFPVGHARYTLLVPAVKTFNFKTRATQQEPTITDVEGNYKLYIWEAKNIEPVKPEPLQPELDDMVALVEVSSVADWQKIASWYSNLAALKAKPDFDVKKTVEEILSANPNASDWEKAKLFYEYIEKNITYSNVSFMHGPIIPQKASRTLSTKLGDCKDVSTLFVSMCKEAGLKANLVLVNTRDNGEQNMLLPSIEFNHCIAQLDVGGKKTMIELTDKFLSIGTLPDAVVSAQSLVIPNEDEPLQTTMKKLESGGRVKNGVVRRTTLSFAARDMNVTKKTVKTGDAAASIRSSYVDQGEEERMKDMSQSISNDYKGNLKMHKLTFGDLKSLADSVNYEYTFTVSNELNDVAGLQILEMPWTEKYGSLDFLNPETRTSNLNLWQHSSSESEFEEIIIEVPQGKVLAEVPKSVKFTCKAADYAVTYKQQSGKLIATRTFTMKSGSITPTEYKEVRDFYYKMNEEDNRQIAFKAGVKK